MRGQPAQHRPGHCGLSAENNQFLPISFNYRDSTVDPSTGFKTPTSPKRGRCTGARHLSGSCRRMLSMPGDDERRPPANDPPPGQFDANQTVDCGAIRRRPGRKDPSGRRAPSRRWTALAPRIDVLARLRPPRLAYSAQRRPLGSEQVRGRIPGRSAVRIYHNVTSRPVDNPAGTILATE